jgi:predicted nucleic acid-binding protein
LSYYLDTSAIYSYIFEDAHSPAVEKWIGDANRPLIISDWVESEFGALINRRVRDGGLAVDAALSGLSEFDSFALGTRNVAECPPPQVRGPSFSRATRR